MQLTEKEDKLILAHAEDAMEKAERQYCTCHVGFLNPRQRTLISNTLYLNNANSDVISEFCGGYPDAERTMLIFRYRYEDFSIDDILSVIRIYGRDLKNLNHRDYLGSLMGLGIVRESIGDIIVCDDGAFIYVKEKIADYIMQNLTKIGRHGIKCEICPCSEAKLPTPEFSEVKGTVPSMRLDAVLAFSAGISRTRAAEMIDKGLVSVNFEVASSLSAQLKNNDLISARGIGRIRIKEIGSLTRKGRLGITVLKYK